MWYTIHRNTGDDDPSRSAGSPGPVAIGMRHRLHPVPPVVGVPLAPVVGQVPGQVVHRRVGDVPAPVDPEAVVVLDHVKGAGVGVPASHKQMYLPLIPYNPLEGRDRGSYVPVSAPRGFSAGVLVD